MESGENYWNILIYGKSCFGEILLNINKVGLKNFSPNILKWLTSTIKDKKITSNPSLKLWE